MSNVLSPIVARFSLFFTLTMFSSSIISQSRQPTHLVQILLIEAERRYHDNTTKKLRALIRNASTSTSSSSISKLSSLQTSSATTELSSLSSCKEHSSEEAPTIVLDLSSFPLMSNGEDSSSEKSAEHESSAAVFTPVNEADLSPELTTAASRANANAVSGILNQQHQSQQTQTSSKKHLLNQTVTPSIQKTNVSRSSIATLLSVTLTMILLSLLQNKKRCMRRITRSLREESRRHRRSKHLHRDGYKSSSSDRFTNPPYSQSSRNSTLTLMDNNTEGGIHPISPFLVNPSHSSTGITTKTSHEPTPYMILQNVESDHQSSAPSSPVMPNFESGHNIRTANLYGVTNTSWSLSDGHLPEMQTKDDFVEAWLSHQDFTVDNHRTPNESNENAHMSDRQHHHRYHHRHHSQSSSHLPQSSPSLYNKTSHGHLGHHYHSSYYHQHRPVQPLPYWQEHHHHSAHKHIHCNAPENQHPRYDVHQEQNGYIHSQTQHRYDIPNTGNVNLERDHSLSWTRSSTIRSQNNKALPPSPPKQEELSLAEQARQEHQLRRQRYQMHHQYLQQYRQQQQMQQQNYYRKDYQQHTLGPYAHYYHPQNHSKHMSDYDFGQYPIMHHLPKTRSANELAWERHCYYQQQQHLEEVLAEQKRKEVQRYVEQQGLEQDMLHPLGQDPTARTVSLNRISSASLSPNAAQALGLSQSKPVFSISESDDSKPINNRTNTSTKVKDILLPLKESETETPPISDRNKSSRFLQNNGSKDLEATFSKMLVEQIVSNMDSADDVAKDLSLLQPISEIVAQESVTLNRKSTFSIRSLARRCSRFGSRRPNSFAGLSNDPIISLPEREENNKNFKMSQFVVSELSETLESQPKLQSMVDVTKRSSLITPVTTSFQLLGAAVIKHERVPIHRKVTLFRSEIMAHSNSSQPIFNQEQSVMASETSQRKKSLSTNPRDTSLRLANGHGVDLPALKSRVHLNGTVTKDIELPTNDLEELIPVEENTTHDTSEFEQQDKARRQIIELLGMGRKERISAKTGLTMAARLKTKSSVTTPKLTPLALEACQDLSLIDPTSTTNEEVDPCEHIAFMLVPKSRYEFQPLVAV